MINTQKSKIVVILGPTSSGKSSVAIKLAQKFNGEIISADSRQIYRGMDVGTGKVTSAEQALAKHYMLDIVSPKTNFSAAQFKKKAQILIADILKRGKLPIICGGTGFWIKALVDDVIYPEVKPDWKLREKLGKKSTEQLFVMLEKLDPVRAGNIDAKNPVRLIRAIEICRTLGKVPVIASGGSTSIMEVEP
ncbi:MAG: tRNA (adenosine(37)-N6)-dimethylallyltransferase MiaA, partial [Candidatus Moraniibacteriota bacterium]